MNIPWTLIFDLIADLIAGCGEARAKANAHRPFFQRWAATKVLREAGFRGKELRAARGEVMDVFEAAATSEIDEFVSQALDQ